MLESGEESVTAPTLSSVRARKLDFSDQVTADNQRDLVLVYELWEDDERLSMGVMPFVPNKHLSLTDPGLSTTVRQEDDHLVLEVTAKSLARFIELSLDGVDVVFSDNYFDVPTGRTVVVTCPLPEGWTVGKARETLRLRSLYDSFA